MKALHRRTLLVAALVTLSPASARLAPATPAAEPKPAPIAIRCGRLIDGKQAAPV